MSVLTVDPYHNGHSFRRSPICRTSNQNFFGGKFLPPATKLRQGNVFTPVCHSVHRGEVSVQGGLCLGGSLSREVSFQGVSVLGVSVQGGLCPGGSMSRGVSVWREVSVRPHTVTSGRYASYWNAFLFPLPLFLSSFVTFPVQID